MSFPNTRVPDQFADQLVSFPGSSIILRSVDGTTTYTVPSGKKFVQHSWKIAADSSNDRFIADAIEIVRGGAAGAPGFHMSRLGLAYNGTDGLLGFFNAGAAAAIDVRGAATDYYISTAPFLFVFAAGTVLKGNSTNNVFIFGIEYDE